MMAQRIILVFVLFLKLVFPVHAQEGSDRQVPINTKAIKSKGTTDVFYLKSYHQIYSNADEFGGAQVTSTQVKVTLDSRVIDAYLVTELFHIPSDVQPKEHFNLFPYESFYELYNYKYGASIGVTTNYRKLGFKLDLLKNKTCNPKDFYWRSLDGVSTHFDYKGFCSLAGETIQIQYVAIEGDNFPENAEDHFIFLYPDENP